MSKSIGWIQPIDESEQWDGFNDPGIETFAGSPLKNLAREVIQNSIDATQTTPAIVDFLHRTIPTESIPDVDEFIDLIDQCKLSAHTEGEKAAMFFDRAAKDIRRKSVSVLQITDRNTYGMLGPSTNGTPFYAFTKAKGQSRKTDDTASGSFGIGKYAPYAVSRLRTVMVSTCYNDNGFDKLLTQGKAILMSVRENNGRTRHGTCFWGSKERCQPVEGHLNAKYDWIQHKSDPSASSSSNGTTLSILGFDTTHEWDSILTRSVLANFFGTIESGRLQVNIGDSVRLNNRTLPHFFTGEDKYTFVTKGCDFDELEEFKTRSAYYEAIHSNNAIVESSQQSTLGHCELRILMGEGLPRRVCILRNGMFITDSLKGLKTFADCKDFVAVIQCLDPEGNKLLRRMEPPRHDKFEPERLSTPEDIRKAKVALSKLSTWVRQTIMRHAQNPTSDTTSIDELTEYFAEEDISESGQGTETNPFGKIQVWAKRQKHTTLSTQASDDSDTGEDEDGSGGGGATGTSDGGDSGGKGDSSNGVGGGDNNVALTSVSHVRAVTINDRRRRLYFTSLTEGTIRISLYEAGADKDYATPIAMTSSGSIVNSEIELSIKKGQRYDLTVDFNDPVFGALTLKCNEVRSN